MVHGEERWNAEASRLRAMQRIRHLHLGCDNGRHALYIYEQQMYAYAKVAGLSGLWGGTRAALIACHTIRTRRRTECPMREHKPRRWAKGIGAFFIPLPSAELIIQYSIACI
jgi:hypothetical protein